jgi:hypothetical protein
LAASNSLIKVEGKYRNELELLDIRDIEQARQKTKIVEKKLEAYQQTSWCSLEGFSSKYIPPHKSTPPPYTRQDKDQCFKCNAPNWKPDHKCKDNKFFHYKIDKSDNNKDEEAGDISSSGE